MVDLHSHTDRSDGALSPAKLVGLARDIGLSALGITDHDTLQGYDEAASLDGERGLDLVCGVELSAKYDGTQIHILGYFLDKPPGEEFRRRLDELAESRRERNEELAEKLRGFGLEIELAEVAALGRGQTGRPHFARMLIQKGYVADYHEAFERYLDQSAPGFVPRREPSLEIVLESIRQAGGISSWAHPGRFLRASERSMEAHFAELRERGMAAIEAYHTDHNPDECQRIRRAAESVGMALTGGSDFHEPRPGGPMLGGLSLPDSLLEALRSTPRSTN